MRNYKQGHHNQKRVPYGWRISRYGYHMVDKQARKNIFNIVCLRSQGLTYQKIKESLEARELPSPRNSVWHCATIRKIFEVNSKSFPNINSRKS